MFINTHKYHINMLFCHKIHYIFMIDAGVEPSPCFSNFLARTTFVLESLAEAKNPGQDSFWGILSLTVVNFDIKAYLIIDCDYW